MNRIRIARILGRPNVGGPVRTVLHLTRKLAAFGYETLLLVGASDDDEGDALAGITDGDGFTIRRISSLRRSISLRDFVARRALERELAEFRPAIVHTHAAKAGALGRRAAFSLAVPPKVVHTYHGHSLAGYFPAPVAKCFAWIERGLAKRTAAIVAVSERVRHELADVHRVAPAERIEVIANGIDLAPFPSATPERRAAARSRLGCGEDRIVLLVPARLVPIKDHAFLFAALERMGERAAEFEVHLCGDGPLRSELESRVAALRGVRVVFHGLRNDLPDVLPGADLVTLTSKNEGMSLALIEAMASGAAIVATNVGGTPDLIEDGVTGRLVAAGDIDGLATALTTLARDREGRIRLGLAARAHALEHHGIDRVIAAHDALYRRLVAVLERVPARP